MAAAPGSQIDIQQLIERKRITIHFQPIASIRRGAIVGVEALCRGIDDDGHSIPPMRLFQLAAAAGLTLELDRLCRATALETFLPLHTDNPNLILFVNFQPTTIEHDAVDLHNLSCLMQHFKLDPRNVAIEVLETEFENETRLRNAIACYKQHEFLVVIDDIGIGHSNLSRIPFIQPDIIKVDRSIVHNLHTDYYKQEVLKALTNLAERIGGWVIVEGIEQQAEAICALELGADMLQGFYFARPHKVEHIDDLQPTLDRIQAAAAQFKRHTLDRTRATETEQAQRQTIARQITTYLQDIEPEQFEAELAEQIGRYPTIESACILNAAGIQITETLRNPTEDQKQKTIIFQPPAKGTNHAFKEYYYLLTELSNRLFETNPYVPLPSSDLCVTVSTQFEVSDRRFILCLHILLVRV